jgi:hypothetical protein
MGLSKPVMGLLYFYLTWMCEARGGALVDALCYTPEGRGIDS